MDATQVKTKLIGYGFSLLEGIDPNPEVIIIKQIMLILSSSEIFVFIVTNEQMYFISSTELRLCSNYTYQDRTSWLSATIRTK